MSVVVRMEMPNGCHDCKLRNMVGNCPIPMFDGQDEKKIWTLAECFQRPPWCPILCQLPEGHGDLIDASTFKKNMDYVCSSGGWLEPVTSAVTDYVKNHIDAQTVVVPAERSET